MIKNSTNNTIEIVGTGSYIPETTVDNTFMEQLVETSDEWITTRTGIHARHLAGEESTVFMASEAAKRALEDAEMQAGEVELILCATISPDYAFPSTACLVQRDLGALNAVAMDLSAACSGFIFALHTAYAYISAGICSNALLIGAEALSRHVDWADRGTCVLFGDGAGAAVVRRSERGLLALEQGSDGEQGMVLSCAYPPVSNPIHKAERIHGYMQMDGQAVFKFAVKKVPECIHTLLDEMHITTSEVSHYLLHQANIRIIQSIAKRLDVPLEKFPSNLDKYGNTSAASIPILLDEVHRDGLLKAGERIVLAGFGGGLTWGACLLEWTK